MSREKVRQLLSRHYLTHTWLINQLESRGVLVASSELSDILLGKRKGDKADRVINVSLSILNDYEEKYYNQRDN